MTAEIAILSRSAVAIAADSAVTIERQIGPTDVETRVLKGANKVFALSTKNPVAVMIFGDASLMGVPWETLIKMYRSERGNTSFDTLAQYPRDFFSFLETHDSLFPAEVQDAAVVSAMQKYAFMVLGQAFRKAKAKKASGKRAMNRIVGEEIDAELTFTKKCKFARGFDANKAKNIEDKYRDQITQVIAGAFGAYVVSKPRKVKLRTILVAAVTRIWFQEASAGIAFAGFGESEHYPSLIAYRCRGVFQNVLLRTRREEETITAKKTAAIVPFAQTEMVKTFIYGIDPAIMDAVSSFLTEAFKSLNSEIRARAPAISGAVSSAAKTIRKQFDDDFVEYISENHAQPVYRIVDALSKEELAELAENLIVMESLKKRITQPIESVGGPIDVAVVSKAEGVIWIKRKHYFQRELNEDFFIRRKRG